MKHFNYTIALALFGLLAFSAPAFAASVFLFSSATVSARVGETFTLRISLNPQGVKNYTAKAAINFPADLVKVNGFTFADKWLPLAQAGYDALDNAGGLLVKTAGYPAGTSASATFGTVSFTAKKAGSGTIKLGGNSLALDAGGQNVLSGGAQTTVTVTAPAETSSEAPGAGPIKTVPQEVKKPAPKRIESVKKPAAPKVEGAVREEEGAVRGEETSAGTSTGAQIITVPPAEPAAPETGLAREESAEAGKAPASEPSINSILSLGTNKTWVASVVGAVMAALVIAVIMYLARRLRKKKTENFDEINR